MSTLDPSGRTGPRLRARPLAASTSALRPEVLDALGGLERSIGEVTEWEHQLVEAGAVGATAPERGLVVRAGVTREEAASDLDLSTLFDEDAFDDDPLTNWTDADWTDEDAAERGFGPSEEMLRRRRNGRILSWSGAIVLVALAAFLLLPDHTTTHPLVRETTTTVTSATQAPAPLDGSRFPTIPTTVPAVPVTSAPTTSGAVATGTTRARATTTTVDLSTTPPPTTTPSTTPPTTTTTTPPTTTTTMPPTTTPTIPPTTTILSCQQNPKQVGC